MNWLALLKALLQVASYVSKYVHDEQLLDAGEARALRQQLEVLNEKVNRASEARKKSVADSASGGLLNDDGYKRD
jgi:hypothetical protein